MARMLCASIARLHGPSRAAAVRNRTCGRLPAPAALPALTATTRPPLRSIAAAAAVCVGGTTASAATELPRRRFRLFHSGRARLGDDEYLRVLSERTMIRGIEGPVERLMEKVGERVRRQPGLLSFQTIVDTDEPRKVSLSCCTLFFSGFFLDIATRSILI